VRAIKGAGQSGISNRDCFAALLLDRQNSSFHPPLRLRKSLEIVMGLKHKRQTDGNIVRPWRMKMNMI
jgi:hypothetical protein